MTDRDFEVIEATQDALDFLKLPDWKGTDERLFMTLTKEKDGEKSTKTLAYTMDAGLTLSARLVSVPVDTQPTPALATMQEAVSFKECFEHGLSIFNRYLYLTAEWQAEILTLASMSTYFRKAFYAYPYIDFKAPILECGKTTALLAFCGSAFYGASGVDPTGPVIYRYIEDSHATLGFDELDNTLTKPDAKTSTLGILNASYRRGLKARRMNMEKNIVEDFDAFGLKVFSHVSPIPDSLSSRSIIFHMTRSPRELPDYKDDSVFTEYRDYMYWHNIHSMETVLESIAFVEHDCGLKNRGRQKFLPVLTMAYLVSPEVYERSKEFALLYMAGGASDQTDLWQVTLIEACINIGKRKLGDARRGEVQLREITEEFNKLAGPREIQSTNEDGTAKQTQSRTIKSMLEPYGIYQTPTRTHNYVHILLDMDKIASWASVFSLSDPEASPQQVLTSPTESISSPKSEASEDSEPLYDETSPSSEIRYPSIREDIGDTTKLQKFIIHDIFNGGLEPHLTQPIDFATIYDEITEATTDTNAQRFPGVTRSHIAEALLELIDSGKLRETHANVYERIR